MARFVTGWMLVIYTLAANRLFGADGHRFSQQAETTIGVLVGNQELTARLWRGRTEVVESGLHRIIDAAAIYLPGSKLLWWTLGYAPPDATPAQGLQVFKKHFRCVAESSAIVCFRADHWYVLSIQSGEKVDSTDIAALVGKRFAQLTPNAVLRKLRGGEPISLIHLTGLAPLFAPPHGAIHDVYGLYTVTKAVPDENGWELNIQESVNGRVGSVRLDRAMRPISGTMIK